MNPLLISVRLGFASGFLALTFGPLLVLAQGITIEETVRVPPSHLTPNKPQPFFYRFACLGLSAESRWQWSLLDCPFSLKVFGLKQPTDAEENNGGHQHDHDSHPLIFPADGKLEYVGDKDPSKLGVEGTTARAYADVTWVMPEVAGSIVAESIVQFPPLYSPASVRWLTTVDVGLREPLLELPSSSFYVRCGRSEGCTSDTPGTDSRHPRQHFGRPELVSNLIGLAAMHRSRYAGGLSAQKLRFLDISLPKGGQFDMTHRDRKAPWIPPHVSHRRGTSVDVSRHALLDGGGTVFVDQDELNKMVKRLGLRRHTETSAKECPGLPPGEPPCIHIEIDL